MVQLQFQMLDEAWEALKAEAAKKGISPNMLARLIMNERYAPPDTETKTYTFTTKNWQEIESYVDAKRLGSVEGFVGFAMNQYMTKYPLTKGQKQRIDENIGVADTPR